MQKIYCYVDESGQDIAGSRKWEMLADSMAGFIRDYEEGKLYSQELYPRFSHQQIITRLET
jgi:hypothetical protein